MTEWNLPTSSTEVHCYFRVKTFSILMCVPVMCRDKQKWKEAIELRQAPKSVKPCYPKERKKKSIFSYWVGLLLGNSTHTLTYHKQQWSGWMMWLPVNIQSSCSFLLHHEMIGTCVCGYQEFVCLLWEDHMTFRCCFLLLTTERSFNHLVKLCCEHYRVYILFNCSSTQEINKPTTWPAAVGFHCVRIP